MRLFIRPWAGLGWMKKNGPTFACATKIYRERRNGVYSGNVRLQTQRTQRNPTNLSVGQADRLAAPAVWRGRAARLLRTFEIIAAAECASNGGSSRKKQGCSINQSFSNHLLLTMYSTENKCKCYATQYEPDRKA